MIWAAWILAFLGVLVSIGTQVATKLGDDAKNTHDTNFRTEMLTKLKKIELDTDPSQKEIDIDALKSTLKPIVLTKAATKAKTAPTHAVLKTSAETVMTGTLAPKVEDSRVQLWDRAVKVSREIHGFTTATQDGWVKEQKDEAFMSQGKDPNDSQMKLFLGGMSSRFWQRNNDDFSQSFFPEAKALHKELIGEVPEANDNSVDWANPIPNEGYITGVRDSINDMTCALGVKLKQEGLIATTYRCPYLL